MPQAMSAGMFGITMFDSDVPTFWRATRGLNPARVSVVVVIADPSRGVRGRRIPQRGTLQRDIVGEEGREGRPDEGARLILGGRQTAVVIRGAESCAARAAEGNTKRP
ncbi:hypothetical protein GCM10009793_32610 [Brachybacterium phenoliresistens]